MRIFKLLHKITLCYFEQIHDYKKLNLLLYQYYELLQTTVNYLTLFKQQSQSLHIKNLLLPYMYQIKNPHNCAGWYIKNRLLLIESSPVIFNCCFVFKCYRYPVIYTTPALAV